MRRYSGILLATVISSLLVSGVWTLSLPSLPAGASGPPTVTPSSSPAYAVDSPDPDVVRVGSTFYAFTTGTTWGNQIGMLETGSGGPASGWEETGAAGVTYNGRPTSSAFPQVPYYDSLAPWETAETTTSPGVFHFDNQWIMFYDAVDTQIGINCISVATASSVTGPYTDNSSGPLVCQWWLGGDLDPQPFVDPVTGDPYLIWKSNDGSSSSASQVWSQPLSSNGVTLAGSPTAIFTIHSANYSWQTTTDDPSMAYAGGNYYLFFSGGDFQSSYYPTGYVKCTGPSGGCDLNESPDPILNVDPGGSGGGQVFSDGSGNWWISYQTWEPTSCTSYDMIGCERQIFIAPISLPTLPLPSITTSSPLPAAGAGTPYSQTLTATSGTGSYTWSITSGTLPSGLSLNSTTGAITGTASATSGPTSVTFEVTDAEGETATKALSITVLNGSSTAASVNPTSTTLGQNVMYSATVTAVSSGGTPSGSVTFSIDSATLCVTAALVSGAGSCTASTAPAGAETVIATYSGDSNFAPSVGTASLVIPSGVYSPLTPVRICDTRAGNPSSLTGAAAQCNGSANVGSTISAGGTKTITVAGDFGVPSDATAVVLNVTVVYPAGPGFLTVFPAGASQPTASNLNYVAGEVVPNLVEVGLPDSGDVSIYSSARADVVVDVEGYTSTTSLGGAGLYNPLAAPVRICDTRAGNPSGLDSAPDNQCNGAGNRGETLSSDGTINVLVAGDNGIPVGATAAVFNVTVVSPTQAGYLTVYPQGATQPFASNVNYVAGQVVPNRVTVPLSTSGATPGYISVFSSSPANVVVDVSGYYTASGGTGSQFTSEGAPVRICDTRPGNPSGLSGSAAQCNGSGNAGRTIGTGGTLTIQVSGLAEVPSGATAVVVNLTGVAPSATTFLTVFPNALPSPLVSDLNPVAGDVRANLTVATLSPSGTMSIYNYTGNTDVVVDVLGWYSS